MFKIACVGSRDTPSPVLKQMEEIGVKIATIDNLYLATGNAKGADQAFARGANSINPKKVMLFLPWATYEKEAIEPSNILFKEVSSAWEAQAAKSHPIYYNLSQGVQKLLMRNVGIVSEAALVVGYLNPAKKGGGGTGHSFRIAEKLGIETINLAEEGSYDLVLKRIKEFSK